MPRVLKLERMEIVGFKSFYGRTRFEFPEGITAVVGPNGCGKSNIGDAISWVLGEQKASSLRSDRMEDVIFNGSDARRPLGMAEVSLHFRNLLAAGPGGNGHAGAGGNGHGANGHKDAGAVVAEAAAARTDPAGTGGAGTGPAGDAGTEPAPPGVAAPPPAGGEDRVVPIPAAAEAPAAEEDRRPRIFSLEEIPESVVVTRRLYRSGESEYILNGERCRLRDVQDLLARTDIGSRLYSTIEQGKIDQILAARPKDRRALFEEAAGILGYKTRRRQAEAKLEASQANLLRIADIAAEVEKQIQSLKRQAARARRHQRLVEALREKRLLQAQRRLLALRADRDEAVRALEALGVEEAAAAAALARDEAELEALRQRLEEGEAAARRHREEIHGLDLELDRLAERLRSGEEQGRDLRARLEEAAVESEALRARLGELETRRDTLDGAAAREATALRTAQTDLQAAERAVAERATAVTSIETRLEEDRAALVRLLEAAAALERQAAELGEQARGAQAGLERLRLQAADQDAGRRSLAGALDGIEAEARQAAAALEDLRVRRARLATDEAAAAARLKEAERRVEERRGRETALRERAQALDRMTREHAGAPEAVRAVLAGAAGVAARGLAGGGLEVPGGLERAVEAALGDRLQAILVADARDAVRGVGHLRAGGAGRAAFAPAAGSPAAAAPVPPAALAGAPGVRGVLKDLVRGAESPAVRAVLGRTILIDTLEVATELQAAHPGWAFVTPDGDVVDADGVVTGGDGRALDHGLLARRAELAQVARQADEAAREREEAEGALPRLREERAALLEALRLADAAALEREREAVERDVVRRQQAAEIARLQAAAPALASEIDRLAAATAEALRRRDLLVAERAAGDDRRRLLEGSIGEAGTVLAARRGALEVARGAAGALRAAAAAGAEKIDGLRREREAIEAALPETRTTLKRRGMERDEAAARLAMLERQAQALRSERDAAGSSRAAAAARDEAHHAGLAYERSLLHAREQGVREARQAHADLLRRTQERELQRARAEAHLDGLAAACQDELGLTLEALGGLPPPAGEQPAGDLDAEIERLRADLDGLGPVNLMAIEQHGELEERHGFLSAQKADLEASVASLQETIRRINRQSRQRFQEAFGAIQGFFLETFQTLFGGGRAELRLQEDEDVLEAGVEIVAQPPGKRLQKIALLSGGEKALTAAALLFSLFRYRPSPFCVLDEVDAPLDEANVERFTGLLKALRDDTQFILITHNRKSMEAADLLYGVTMEEPGVSKVLPLRFE